MKEGSGEAEGRCVVRSPAVSAVAHDRMTDRSQVDADLMGTARSGAGLDERGGRQRLKDPNFRGRLLPGPRANPDPGAIPRQRCVDGELLVVDVTTNQGQISAVDGVGTEHLGQRGVGLIIGRHEHQP
jgi:hypothetical protein